MASRIAFAAALLMVAPAWAEKSLWNIHLDPGLGVRLEQPRLATGVSAKLDTTAFESLGPVSPQIEVFGLGATTGQYFNGALFGVGLGARLRLFNDESGACFHPGRSSRGNLWGNYWLDAHLTLSPTERTVGFDVATGASFSVVTGLQIGPFAKFQFDPLYRTLLFGLSFSVGLPIREPAFERASVAAAPPTVEAAPKDEDADGIIDRQDKCVSAAEDRDGFEDDDGCPDPDNDRDGVLDGVDKCPNEAGPADNNGCAVLDRDKDGVVDAFDNCVDEAGPASNQGCPLKQKQLVVITQNSLKILDKVYFDTGKSSIQKRSYALLSQIAQVLGAHPEIKTIQIEGHTDNKGNAEANKTLSGARAESVRVYLITRGVEGTRLRAAGFGADKPQDSNDTVKGREANRRVEFNILTE
jgi:outer membrane protein OmpA-like peptidoglycan-associated protein